MIVVFFSRKGGTGKSTLTCSVAVALSKRKKQVCIVDSDPQQICLKWGKYREDINVIQLYENLGPKLSKLEKDFDFVLVDTPGADSLEMRTALEVCDKAFHIIKPSSIDSSTIDYVADIVSAVKKRNKKKIKFSSIVSIVSSIYKPSDIKTTKSQLTLGRMPAVKGVVRERRAFLDSMKTGKGVHELDDPAAKREVNAIIKEIMK